MTVSILLFQPKGSPFGGAGIRMRMTERVLPAKRPSQSPFGDSSPQGRAFEFDIYFRSLVQWAHLVASIGISLRQ